MMGIVAISKESNSAYIDLFDYYYRGICPTPTDESMFCGEHAVMSMFTATKTLPYLIIFGLYFGPVLFLINRIIKRPNPFTFETIIHFVFPLVTNISLFGIVPEPCEHIEQSLGEQPQAKKRAQSLPLLQLEALPLSTRRLQTCHQVSDTGCQRDPWQQRNQKKPDTRKKERNQKQVWPQNSTKAKEVFDLNNSRPNTTSKAFKESLKVTHLQLTCQLTRTPPRPFSAIGCWEESVFEGSEREADKVAPGPRRLSSSQPSLAPGKIDNIGEETTESMIVTAMEVTAFKQRRSSLPAAFENIERKKKKPKKHVFKFSWKQSTVLYGFFLWNAWAIGLADLVVQLANVQNNICKRAHQCDISDAKQDISVLESLLEVDAINQAYLVILIINMLSWVTFLLQLRKGKTARACLGQASCSFLQELVDLW